MFTTNTSKGILFYDEEDPTYFRGAIIQGDSLPVLYSFEWQQLLDGFLSTAILNEACSNIDGIYAVVDKHEKGFIIVRSSISNYKVGEHRNPWDIYDIIFPHDTIGVIDIFPSSKISDEWCGILYVSQPHREFLLGSQVDISGELRKKEDMSIDELVWAGQFLPATKKQLLRTFN